MRKILIVTVWLFASAGLAPAQEADSCGLNTVAVLGMTMTSGGHVAIPIQIEGHDYRFVVDTGGYINTVSQQLVKNEGYKVLYSFQTQMKGMGSSKFDSFVTVNDFAIGHAHGKSWKFFVDEASHPDFDGVIAPQILANYDADFDFAHDRLNLIAPDHCPGKVIYWTRQPYGVVPIVIKGDTHITVPVTIDGKEIDAILDTGAPTSTMSLSAATRLLDLKDNDPALQLLGERTINGMKGPVYSYPFQSLSFGAVTATRPRIQVISDKVWNSDNQMLVGLDLLRQLHLYIAYRERKLYVTPAEAN